MPSDAPPPERERRSRWAALAAPVALLAATAVWQVAVAASTVEVDSPGNAWTGGTVALSDSGAGSAVIAVTGAAPGDAAQHCITVRYDGDVAAEVRLSVPDLTGDLAQHLAWTVEEGTGGDPSCAGFTPAAGTTASAGTLAGFAADHPDFDAGWGVFAPTTTGDRRVYRVTYAVADVDAAQRAGASFSLRWEARSS